MKKTSLKYQLAQQKVFSLLGAPSRLRIVNQLIATPNMNVSELARRTGFSVGTVHKALKDLEVTRVVCMGPGMSYYVDERTINQITNLCEDSAELGFLLSKFKPQKKATSAILRAVL